MLNGETQISRKDAMAEVANAFANNLLSTEKPVLALVAA